MEKFILRNKAGITLGQVIEQCVDYAFNNMAATDPSEEVVE